ncbi:hypothetical protein [Flavobacterium ginsengisoli]
MSLLALMVAASPDLEKQGFLAVVFVYREYSGQQGIAPENYCNLSELFILKDFKF